MPRKCNVEAAGRPSCPLDPYFILPDKCKCVDFQSMKLQETPDSVPHGEMPRHCSLYLERYIFVFRALILERLHELLDDNRFLMFLILNCFNQRCYSFKMC